MKRILIPILLAVLPCCAVAQEEMIVDQVVAVVGQNVIKLSDIENSYTQIRMRQGAGNAQENRCRILENILLTKLMVHKGLVDSVEVADEDVEQQVQYYLKSFMRQYGGKEGLRQATGYSYDEFHDIYFDLLKDRILSQRVEYNLTQNVKITPAEVAEYYRQIPADSLPTIAESYELAEIVLRPKVSEEERDRIRMELNKLRERVLNGEKFSMLATLYSQDPGSAKKGGELGFFTRGDMVGEFEAAAFALKPGEVSPVIETTYGFHIIQLIERRGNTVNARHILMKAQPSSEDLLAARMRLDSIAHEIQLGNITFEEAARKYSEADSRLVGGTMANPNTGVNNFTKEEFTALYPGIAISGMNAGEVSTAVAMQDDEGQSVYRIVSLVKKRPAHVANLNDDYDKIYNAALQESKNKKIMEWASRMIKNTYVYVTDDYKQCDFQLQWF